MNDNSRINPQVGYPTNFSRGGTYHSGARPPVSDSWGPSRSDPRVSMPYVPISARHASHTTTSHRRNNSDDGFLDRSDERRSYTDVPYRFHPTHAAAIPILLAPVGAAVLGPKILFTACAILLAVGIVVAIAYVARKHLQETRRDSDMYNAMVSQSYESRNY